jgi:16S rRNA processing protein RimM
MDLAEVGYVSKTHGVKGQLVIIQSQNFTEDDVKVVFLEVNGSKVPYFVLDFKNVGNNLIVSFEDVENVEKAKLLCGKALFIEKRFIEEEEPEDNWLGFELIDQKYGSLGTIKEVADNGQQLILTLNFKSKEVILPMVDDFIEKIDLEAHKVWYSAPDGLIDIYLNSEQ